MFVLCRSVYCLCVNVYCTTATGWQPNCSQKYIIYQNISILQALNEQHDLIWKDIAVKSTCIMTTNIIIICNAVNYFLRTSADTTRYIYIIRCKCLYVSQNNAKVNVQRILLWICLICSFFSALYIYIYIWNKYTSYFELFIGHSIRVDN